MTDGGPMSRRWEGFRAIVHVNGRALVWSRRGTDLTDRFPEVAELASAVPPDTVLDGELVIFGAFGRPDFEAIRRRGLLGRIDGAATFIAFILRLGGSNFVAQRFRTRRAALEDRAHDVAEVTDDNGGEIGTRMFAVCP
jgi:ATP-dependent DNA ligase